MAFKKAILAGAAGALAWEAVIGILIALGLPLFDLPQMIGGLMVPHAQGWRWWPFGILLHVMVGVVWAIFYAYFFFYTYDWRPALQGMVFAAGPFLLAGLVMVPQMAIMNPLIQDGILADPGLFAARAGWGGPVSLALGHAVYGAVMGALYTRPVGHAVKRAPANG